MIIDHNEEKILLNGESDLIITKRNHSFLTVKDMKSKQKVWIINLVYYHVRDNKLITKIRTLHRVWKFLK